MSEIAKELFRAFSFMLAVLVVFVWGAYSVGGHIYRRVKKIREPQSAGKRRLSQVAILLSTIGVACIAYGLLVEPYWPEVTRIQIKSTKIVSPVRIVHISDVHSDPKARLEPSLPALIGAEKPDLIVYTGDSINSPAGAPVFLELLSALAKISAVYVAPGNWDRDLSNEFFTHTGAQVLDGTAQGISIRDNKLWVSGVRDRNRSVIPRMLSVVPKEEFSIFLTHRPDDILDIAGSGKVDLYCAGHTHGGQVALPFYGAMITLARFGKRFEAGLYKEENTWLYVTRGIGMEGGSAPRVRFLARPEITVIDVVPQS